MSEKVKKRILMMIMVAFVFVAVNEPVLMVCAKEATGVDAINGTFESFISIVTSIISGLGMIVTLWGLSEWGMAFQGNDGMMQTHSFKRIVGGLIMCIAPQILPILIS